MQVLWNESIFLLLFSKWQCFKYLQCNSQWILWLNHVEDLILHVGKGHWFLTMQLHHFLNTNHTVKVPSKHFAMFIDRSTRRRHILSDVTRGARGNICPRAQHFGGAKLRSECYVLITKCQMSADADNYNSQNVESHCEISSRSPRFAKRSITNLVLSVVSRRSFFLQAPACHCSLTHGCVTTLSENQGCNFPTSLSFYSCVTVGIQRSQCMQNAILRMLLEQQ